MDRMTLTSGNGDGLLAHDLPDIAQAAPHDCDWDPAANNWGWDLDEPASYHDPPYDNSPYDPLYDSPYDSLYDLSLDVWAVDSEDNRPLSPSREHPHDSFDCDDDSLQIWAMDSDDEEHNKVPLDPSMFIPDDNEDEGDIQGTY